MRSLSDGDCSELLTKLLRGQAAKTAQAIVIQLPMSLVPAVRRRGDQMSGTTTALGLGCAKTPCGSIDGWRSR
jgi:hypothetical protein